MKVLTLEPPCGQPAHYAMETDDVTHAMCSRKNQYIREGGIVETRRAVWVVREQTEHDQICMNCERSKAALERQQEPRPPLPCTSPGQLVTLWTRQNDGRALVHSCTSPQANRSRCNVYNPRHAPERWTATAAQKAALITCSLCLKAEGLHEGHPPHKHKPESKRRPKKSHKQTWLDLWYRWKGTYHHSDPRAVGE